YRSIARLEGLVEETLDQSIGLLACRASGSAAPPASLRTACIKMSVSSARAFPDMYRSPGERGFGRYRRDQGADRNEQDYARRDHALMPEMPHAREHHGEAGMIGGGDHLVVAQRAARLDHRGG